MSAADVAKGLTKAQREAIIWASGDDHWGYRFRQGTARGVPSELKQRWIDGCYLTPLGLEVRAILQETPDAQ